MLKISKSNFYHSKTTQLIRQILAGVLFVTGLLITLFFNHYKGVQIPYPALFWVAGFIMIIAGVRLFFSTPAESDKEEKKMNKFIKKLKSKCLRIPVNFSACKIEDNSYDALVINGDIMVDEETDIPIRAKAGVNTGKSGGEDEDEDEDIGRINECVICYTAEIDGRLQAFRSPVLPYDKAALQILLSGKKETILYVDKNKWDQYYFDLEFLKTDKDDNPWNKI